MTKDMNSETTAAIQTALTGNESMGTRKEDLAALANAARERLSNRLVEPAPRKGPEAILALSPELNPVNRFFTQRDVRPHTMAGYLRAVKRVQRILVEVGHANEFASVDVEKFPWHCVDEEIATKYAALLLSRYPNVKSRHNLLGILREILRQCATVDLISMKDLDRLLRLLPLTGHYQSAKGRVLTDEDCALLLQEGLTKDPRSDLRDRTIIMVFLSTGLRVSELVEIEMADLNLDPDKRSVFIKRNKPGRSLTVHLNQVATEMVKEWIAVRGDHPGALFDVKHRPGQILKAPSIGEMIIRRCQKAGLSTKYSSHDFRRTLATTALRQNVDVFTVQRLLGHKNVQVTLVYDRRTELEDRDAVDSLRIPGLSTRPIDGE